METAKDFLNTEFIKADMEDKMSHVIGKLDNEAFAEVLVFKGKKLAGIFSPVFATKSGMDLIHTKVHKFIRSATCIEEDTELKEIIRKMIESDYNALPVRSNDEIVGTVHIFDLLNAVNEKLTNIRIKEISLQKTANIQESDGISKAIQALHENSVRGLVVSDKKLNPLGILSHFDIIRHINLFSHKRDFGQKHDSPSKAFKGEAGHLEDIEVSNFIHSKREVIIMNNDLVTEAIQMMIEEKILNLMVKDAKSMIRAKNILKYYQDNIQGKD